MEKLMLGINEPCHENWEAMSETATGRFCGSCNKTVVDFTGFSDAQLMFYFEKRQGNLLCGQFNNDQLNRWLIKSDDGRSNPVLYKIMLSLFMLIASQQLHAQEKRTEQTIPVSPPANICDGNIESPPQPLSKQISNTPVVRPESPKIRIRGTVSSLNSDNNPMLVIDGELAELGLLNKIAPQKIKNCTVLKGAQATALYGSGATSGVIIITTDFTAKERKAILKK